jgi:hypothetical protein
MQLRGIYGKHHAGLSSTKCWLLLSLTLPCVDIQPALQPPLCILPRLCPARLLPSLT